MLDFCTAVSKTRVSKTDSSITIYPRFHLYGHSDLVVKGGTFDAVWDEKNNTWSHSVERVGELIDDELREAAERFPSDGANVNILYTNNSDNHQWNDFLRYVRGLPDSNVQFDSKVTFLSEDVGREDYRSKRLPYDLNDEEPKTYIDLMHVLYSDSELEKLEWGIGSILAGEPIDKFFVMYGESGTGKSTTLKIIEMLFGGYQTVDNPNGYCSAIDAKLIGGSRGEFSLAAFGSNPLVAIQHDGDLSHIEDNTKLNMLVSHEEITINEKFKPTYTIIPRAVIFLGTNSPVRINDVRSGIIRRLIDVYPTGHRVPYDSYRTMMSKLRFELGSIANRCLNVYRRLGNQYYRNYKPVRMIRETNDIFLFVADYRDWFIANDPVPMVTIWDNYKIFCDRNNIRLMTRLQLQSQLMPFYDEFIERKMINGERRRQLMSGFHPEKLYDEDDFFDVEEVTNVAQGWAELDAQPSIFDVQCVDCPAQTANADGIPALRWDDVRTKLSDINTSMLHYVRVPQNHIVIDFDIADENGEKDLQANLREAAKWPTTYMEVSKSGKGLHLHYIYDGDVRELAPKYADHIEVKVFTGKQSLRRKLTLCNQEPIAHIQPGSLPYKNKDRNNGMVNFEGIKNEKALRTLIRRNLKKQIVPGTKPSIDFIKHDLDEAYDSGMRYDVSDLKPAIISFAGNSTHHSAYCLKQVTEMKFMSDEPREDVEWPEDGALVFFDVEVFPNLLVIVWKSEDAEPVRLVNPTPDMVRRLCQMKLVGFNNRRYDNHILYARMLGYTEEQVYKVSRNIVANHNRNAMFREAYNLSYADIYDFSSKKQSLKKFEIDLGIHHLELDLPWDEPVPEELWGKVADYCVNDVLATEATFKARHADFVAREILAQLSGLTVNDTTRMHATKIIFGDDRNPQSQFVYTDLSEMFPGYEYAGGKSTYRGEEVGEGGYVYAEPGMYENVLTLDVESMHPNSIIALNLFGDRYTKRFKDLLDTRLAIKHRDFETAREMFDGQLAPYLEDEASADDLAYALKIVINSIYGFTAARFDCEFRDPRNIDNIVAKRGALFMVNLKHEVQERGFTVAHIKTDSIKIPNPTPEIISFVNEYGAKYGYHFEEESSYSRLCLVNDAVYIARDREGRWSATGAQFKHPYVFKTLFSHEPLSFEDYCETRSVSGDAEMYLDKNEGNVVDEVEHNYIFVGRTGSFVPVLPGCGGGILLRRKDGKDYAVTGTKGYRWMEAELVKDMNLEDHIDMGYFENLDESAVAAISKFGDFDWFVSEEGE